MDQTHKFDEGLRNGNDDKTPSIRLNHSTHDSEDFIPIFEGGNQTNVSNPASSSVNSSSNMLESSDSREQADTVLNPQDWSINTALTNFR